MRIAWMTLGILAASVSWAQSPKIDGTSHAGPTKKRQPHQARGDQQYPTKDAPLPITILKSGDQESRSQQREADTKQFNADYLDTQRRTADASEKQVFAARTVGWIAFVDIFIGGAALYWLWRTFQETRRAADAAVTNITVSQRAYIFLKALHLEAKDWENGKEVAWKVIATIANSGSTPPRHLRYAMYGVIVPTETVRTLKFERVEQSAKGGFVGPMSEIKIHVADVGSDKRVPGYTTLVWGWIEYGDIFEPPMRHRTEFCFVFGVGALIGLDDGDTTLLPEFTMHDRHNGMDVDCMHKPQPYQV